MLWWEETESEELTSKAVVRSGSCFPSICLSLGGGEVYCTGTLVPILCTSVALYCLQHTVEILAVCDSKLSNKCGLKGTHFETLYCF